MRHFKLLLIHLPLPFDAFIDIFALVPMQSALYIHFTVTLLGRLCSKMYLAFTLQLQTSQYAILSIHVQVKNRLICMTFLLLLPLSRLVSFFAFLLSLSQFLSLFPFVSVYVSLCLVVRVSHSHCVYLVLHG